MPPCMGLGKSPNGVLPPSYDPRFQDSLLEGNCDQSGYSVGGGFPDDFNNWLPNDFVSDTGIYDASGRPISGYESFDTSGYGSASGSCNTSPLPSWSTIQNSPPPSKSSGSSSAGSPPMVSGQTQQQQLCRICNDTATGNHFGVMSCEACKSFFRRSIRSSARYVCRGKRCCEIDKTTRNRCQHCRLQKCVDSGMNKSAVQEERMPYVHSKNQTKSSSDHGSPLSSCQPTTPLSAASNDGAGIPFPFYSLGPTPICPKLLNETLPKAATVLKETLRKAELVNDEPIKVYHNPGSPLTYSKAQENLMRSLMSVIAWSKEIPMYSQLSVDDKLKLIKHSWNILITLKLIHRSVRFQTGRGTMALQNGEISQFCQGGDPMVTSFFDKISKECRPAMEDLDIDEVEFSCLKFISLMNPFLHSLTPNGHKDVERAQDIAMDLLDAHIKKSRPDSSRRLSKLLLYLGQVKANARDVVTHIEAQLTLGFESDSILAELLSD